MSRGKHERATRDGLPLYFADREEAGRRLSRQLEHLRDAGPVILGLPRGGVPVAGEVAGYLDAPFDVVVVRKLGVPWQPELAMGAIGEDGIRILNREVMEALGVGEAQLREVEERERRELHRRVGTFRGDRPPLPLEDRVAVLVDDGVATG
ncbi:MAG: phosphoribosyltransferase, partial [Actinomycetota bacterium]